MPHQEHPNFLAAKVRKLDCSDEVTVTSNAARFVNLQVGTKMCPRLVGLSDRRLLSSTSVETSAEEQEHNIISQYPLYTAIVFPLPGDKTARWS